MNDAVSMEPEEDPSTVNDPRASNLEHFTQSDGNYRLGLLGQLFHPENANASENENRGQS